MDQEAFSKYLTDRYEDQIRWYDIKAAGNQMIYRWMQWSLIVLPDLGVQLLHRSLIDHWFPGFAAALKDAWRSLQ